MLDLPFYVQVQLCTPTFSLFQLLPIISAQGSFDAQENDFLSIIDLGEVQRGPAIRNEKHSSPRTPLEWEGEKEVEIRALLICLF